MGDSLVFDASASTDDSAVTGYSWSTGGTAKTETALLDTVGTKTVSVTVTDAQGLTSTATATVTVTDDEGTYRRHLLHQNFRVVRRTAGQHGDVDTGGILNTWEATVTFDGQTNQRFKLDVAGNQTTNFGDTNADGTLTRVVSISPDLDRQPLQGAV